MMPEERRFAPAHLINSAPQWVSSHLRHPEKAPVLWGLKNLSIQLGLVLHCVLSHIMLSVQHSMHVGPCPEFSPVSKRTVSSNVIFASTRHAFRCVRLGSPPRMGGLANFAAHRVISVVMKCRVEYKTLTSAGELQAEHL